MKKLLTVLILSMALLSGVAQAAEQTPADAPQSLSVAAATQLLRDGKPVAVIPARCTHISCPTRKGAARSAVWI